MVPDQLTQADWTLLFVGAIAALAILSTLPGRVARRRGHPQADAIRIAGWLSLLAVGLTLPVALIWAFTKPSAAPSLSGMQEDINDLWSRVKDLQSRVDLIEHLDKLDAEHDQ